MNLPIRENDNIVLIFKANFFDCVLGENLGRRSQKVVGHCFESMAYVEAHHKIRKTT